LAGEGKKKEGNGSGRPEGGGGGCPKGGIKEKEQGPKNDHEWDKLRQKGLTPR